MSLEYVFYPETSQKNGVNIKKLKLTTIVEKWRIIQI